MNWKDVGEKLASLGLPVLGGALGGPLGAAVGSAVASRMGLTRQATADVVGSYIQNSFRPEDRVKLAELESAERIRIAELQNAAQASETSAELETLKTINETMQAEAKSEHWVQFSWRPFIGFAFGLAFLVVAGLCCLIAWDAVQAKDLSSINMIPQLVFAFSALFAIPAAVLGVAAWRRNLEKK